MKTRTILFGVLTAIILMAASCRTPDDPTKVTNFSLGRTIGNDNAVVASTTKLPSSAQTIYLSAEVTNPSNNAAIRVIWTKLPQSIIASEDFTGARNVSDPFDFDNKKPTSYFASKITRDGISWIEGEYKADVMLNGRKLNTVFFKIVSDSEAEAEDNKNIISRVMFGDSLDDDSQINKSLTRFTRTQDHIYIQVDLAGRRPGERLEVEVRYPKEDKGVNTFTTTTGNAEFYVFDLPLERFGRLWPDRLWPTGSFEVNVKVNGTVVSSPSFVVS